MTAEEVGGPCLWKLGNLGGRWLLLLRAGEMGAAEPNSASDRDFLRTWDGYWLCWLDEAESFFISDINEGLRIMLFLCGNS
jgi:hypothetical protein